MLKNNVTFELEILAPELCNCLPFLTIFFSFSSSSSSYFYYSKHFNSAFTGICLRHFYHAQRFSSIVQWNFKIEWHMIKGILDI